jgi:cytochrome c oxidase assembly protein Cox11
MKTQNRIPNWQLEKLLAARTPFTNYNGTISAEITAEGVYKITHWKTVIIEYELATSSILYFEFGFISQTTSALQGKIVRSLLTAENTRELLHTLVMTGQRRDLRRLKGMARI